MHAVSSSLLAGLLFAPVLAPSAPAQSGRAVAVRAGTIHTVEGGETFSNGTVLIRDGKIVAVGEDLEIPGDATVVDYGPDAVIVPGFVAAMSYYAVGSSSKRTADPDVRAVDSFDPYRSYFDALSAGVTSAYITPSDSRLIAGQGGLVKLAGEDHDSRVVNESSAIHGTIDRSARSAPGYWEPPVPVTVDVGIGVQLRQLPKTAMGAIVALDELLTAGRNNDPDSDYGPRAPLDFVHLIDRGVPLRLGASEPNEIRAVLDFAAQREVRVILDKAYEAGALADEIAAAGVGVIYRVPYTPNSHSFDRGKDEDSRWYTFDVPARLVAAGAKVAITGTNPRDLLFAAGLAMRGGLSEAEALRAITLTPAQLLGGATRIGSLTAGKDADLCVLNGEPLSGQAGVVATWVAGEKVWWFGMAEASRSSSAPVTTRAARRARARAAATVIEVDELHIGDGEVLSPGQILLRDGRIAEVASRVSHPPGVHVVRGKAAMPGMIDAFGHLGLEGSRKVPATDFELTSIVEPGDEVDRRVASYGITTVVLTPRGASSSGSPVMAYKPAAKDLDHQVIGDPVALRLRWRESVRIQSGSAVAKLLQKALDYRTKWEEYEQAMAAWVPPAEEPEADKKDEDEDEEAKDEDEKEDDKKKKKKKKKRKKGELEELEPDPITGEWVTELNSERLRLRLLFENPGGSGPVEGTLRCDTLSATLIEIAGNWDLETRDLTLEGRGSDGKVALALRTNEGKLEGEIQATGGPFEVELERKSKEYPVARRTERRKIEVKKKKAPKGKPKMPKRDRKLEPIVRAMSGETTIVIEVQREDEISACVALFSKYGIRPVLFGADDAHHVADEIAGKVAGILLSPTVMVHEADRGIDYRMPYSDLQQAGIPVAFHSGSEEGAIDLPLRASFAVANGMSPSGALRALTSDAAVMMSIAHRVGRLEVGLDGDVLLLDGPPLAPGTSVLRTWVNGEEVKP